VLGITLSDLRFRARQFLIAVLGAGLVFAMSMLLSGLANGFSVEINQTVQGFGADAWVIAQGSSGRLSALPPLEEFSVIGVLSVPGVRSAAPVVVQPKEATVAGSVASAVVIGSVPAVIDRVPLQSGRTTSASGEVIADTRLGAPVGTDIVMAGRTFRVVGVTSGRTLVGGLPDVYMSLSDAQAVCFNGLPVVSAFITHGTPGSLPKGLVSMSNAKVEAATLQAMKTGVSSINNSRIFMWFIAAIIVASLVYVTALQRTRDFAVLKALGCSSVRLFGGLALEAVIVSVAAALVGMALSNYMTGVFAQPVDIPINAFVVIPVSALVVGLLASLIALRRAVSVDPVTAFAGA